MVSFAEPKPLVQTVQASCKLWDWSTFSLVSVLCVCSWLWAVCRVSGSVGSRYKPRSTPPTFSCPFFFFKSLKKIHTHLRHFKCSPFHYCIAEYSILQYLFVPWVFFLSFHFTFLMKRLILIKLNCNFSPFILIISSQTECEIFVFCLAVKKTTTKKPILLNIFNLQSSVNHHV